MNINSLTPVSSTPSLNTTSSDVTQSSSKDITSVHSLSVATNKPKSEIASDDGLAERRQAALSLVDRTLAAAYEKISSRGKSAVEAYESVEPLTATKVASNILGFIERRLQADVADGATQEQLQSRLEAGLSGFKKGFAEASEQLKALSLLSPEIEADLAQTNDLVLKGIDDLRSKFITATDQSAATTTPESGSPPSVPAAPVQPSSEQPAAKQVVKSSSAAKSETGLQLPTVLSSGVSASLQPRGNYDYASASQFSFELITAEGDKVTIRASASTGVSGQYGADGYDVGVSSSQSVSFSVDGELSQSELKAINDLLGRVNDLAGQFFAGNLDEAFDQAVNLGYDESQIGSFALDLVQVDIQLVPEATDTSATETPTDAVPEQSDSSSLLSLSDQLYPLGNFIKRLLDALELPASIDDPKGLLLDASKNMIGKDDEGVVQATRFSDFVKKIFALDLTQPTDVTDTSSKN